MLLNITYKRYFNFWLCYITDCENNREEHLEELVNRLENVTERLEKIPVSHSAVHTQDIAVQTSTPSPKKSAENDLSKEPESPVSSNLCSNQQTIYNKPVNMSVAGYKELLNGPVKEYLALSEKIGADVAMHSKLVEKAFQLVLLSAYITIVK